MRRTFWIGVVTVFLGAGIAALAQTTSKAPAYDVKHEVTLTGKVVKMEAIPDWMGWDGINLALDVPDAAAVPHVDVCTARFLQMFEVQIAVGDELKVKGSWGQAADGTPVFLVHELKNKKVMLNVRDPDGKPLW